MDLVKFDLPPGTMVRLCEESEVSYQNGWRLIAIVPWKGRKEFQEDLQDERGNYLRRLTVWRDVESVRYVLAQDENETVAIALRAEMIAKNELREVKNDLGAAQADLAKEKASAEKLKGQLTNWEANYRAVGTELSSAQAAKRKMELDIGKLREALGTQRMREFLGDK